MNPWEEFQQYAPSSSGVGTQLTASQPTQTPPMPPSSPEEYEQRVQGWSSALGELIRNPGVATALLQMGVNFSSGMRGPQAVAGGFGAMGRAAGIQNELAQQQLKNRRADQMFDLEQRKFGLEERELSAREKLWEMQAKNYERLAGGGGRGGGAGGAAPSAEELMASFKRCMTLPGATEDTCRQAVLRDAYNLSQGRYTAGAGNLSAAEFGELEKRAQHYERLAVDELDEDKRAGWLKKADETRMMMQQGQAVPAPTPTFQAPPAAAATAPTAPRPQAMTFATMAEAEAAAAAGKIPPGTPDNPTVVIINGIRFRWDSPKSGSF